ncbi:hypothetical protein [Actinomadura flavalba]|uniref:hypothetical protein n=1 Tax=Actinomadura flavalba TaxID=1120938 RepID=UPI0003826582|nr:hypothetical protein [Actinomadura flavalba]
MSVGEISTVAVNAEMLREATEGFRAQLPRLAQTIRQSDGEHLDLGANTAEIRAAAHAVADAAENADAVLRDLSAALARLAVCDG